MRRAAVAVAVFALGCAGAAISPRAHLIDLTHAFDSETVYWPTEEGFVLEPGTEGLTDAGYYYAAHRFRAAEHGGTHIDAPIHFHAERWTVDEIPIERLVGPGVRVDVSEACSADRNHRVSRDDLAGFEAAHGRIPDGAIVLLQTGFGRFWPDRRTYLGTAERGEAAVSKLRFPGLHPEAARWLVEERRIRAVGLDTASIDHGPSRLFETHQTLFAANVPAFENLADLESLPDAGFSVVALPMKIRGGSGAPLRVIAIVPER